MLSSSKNKYTLIKAHGLYLTQNMYPLVVMTNLMKTLLPLLGTQKIEENCLTANFSDAFLQQQKNIWIKTKGLKLAENLCTLVVIKNLMKTLIPLVRKTASTVRNWKHQRKLINT